MRDVKIPNWLKGLPLAPEFRPTDTEFADPIAYISKIEKEASAFGICKVIPPLPKPSKKYVISNLNNSLLKCPELGSEENLSNIKKGEKGNDEEGRAVFTTRLQELGQSAKRTKGSIQPQPSATHKQVWQSGEIYTLEQFESKSKNFARSQLGNVKEVSPLVTETMFWNAASEKPISVEYANDVPGSGFGEPEGSFQYFRRCRRRRTFDRHGRGSSEVKNVQVDTMTHNDQNKGAITCGNPSSSVVMSNCPPTMSSGQTSKPKTSEMEGSAGWKLANSPWNLQVIARSAGSLTRFMPDDIPGVTSPMVYIGMLFSWFAWHVEDHELHSLNFLHTGSAKTWYAVPGDYAFDFEEAIRTKAYGGDIDRLAALTLLGEKTTLLSPEVVVASGIPCCRLVQNPGEFVVTFPRAYHIGFSHGFNCGEAANFGTPKWLEIAKQAAVRRAAMNYLPMLSHQQLLYLLTMSFISSVPRSLLPGARNSRLRDRQKEEREQLVKKAFVEDIINENKLLTTLLGKGSSYHVVLWNLDSLPPLCKESELCGSISTVTPTPKEDGCIENNSSLDVYRQMNMYMETVNNLYVDGGDSPFDFQVDSGSLACVACGILGFPFMSVVQPSEIASMNLLRRDHAIVQELGAVNSMEAYPLLGPNGMVSEALADGQNDNGKTLETEILSGIKFKNGWNTSSEFLRPRIFCLEHAIQVEKLLRSIGGANMLLICHSDFQKVKAHASAIAEEISSPFNYKEMSLDNASQEDLDLINLAIDNEEHDQCGEDWTSKLDINLRYCVKTKKDFPSAQVQHALKLGGLYLDATPTPYPSSLKLNWQSRKFRSRRNLKYPVPSKKSVLEKDKVSGAKSDISIVRKEDKIIQYSRRTFKSRPGYSKGPRPASGDPRKLQAGEVSEAEHEDLNRNSREITESNIFHTENSANSSSGLLVSAAPEKSEMRHENSFVETTRDANENSGPTEVANAPTPTVETIGTEVENYTTGEMFINGEACASKTHKIAEVQHEINVVEEHDEQSNRSSGEESACSLVAERNNSSIQMPGQTQSMEEVSVVNTGCDVMSVDNYGEQSTVEADEYDSMKNVSSSSVDNEVSNCETLDNQAQLEIQNSGGHNEELDSSYVSVTKESTPVLVEETDEVATETHEAETRQSGGGNCSSDENEVITAKPTLRSRRKRNREVELLSVDQFDIRGFTRSPCEGLRPRAGKNAIKNGIGTEKMVEEKPLKKVSKLSGNPASRMDKSGNTKRNPKGSHRCDLDGCRASFQTKAELLLHKRNRCPHEGCGKKFSSHKYAMLHVRVHEDDRPLKCPWKGCTMSFKWAWARTEHIRVHTGERPYKCKIEGCGLTFRFVSDYSRHRRKTGHYVNPPT